MLFRLFLLTLLLTSQTAFSQVVTKTDNFIDGTVAFSSDQGSLAIHYVHLWKLGKSQRFSLGLGGRITTYIGSNQYYITAPAELTSESTSPLIFFKDNIEKNIDSLFIPSPQVTMLNVSINIYYRVTKRLSAGFNIDALGFSFGGKQNTRYINGKVSADTQANPTPFNLLLVSDNDRGSLNSEIFLKYSLNDRWNVKGGLQFLFTEYTTDSRVQKYPSENDRFRVKSFMIGAGIGYKLGVR